tara:strand:- start:4927 stop:7686 length:2760 start_codon:yes stop_codon:yes gene_type:complete
MLKTLQKQNIDKQDFSIFLRDLSQNLNINLKHMIEDSVKVQSKQKKEKKNYHKGKKKVIKKKDLIIQEQTKKRQKIDYEDDQKKIEFLFNELDDDKPFDLLTKLKTEEGITDLKIKLLIHFWENKKKYMKYIIVLFFNLKEMNIKHEIIEKVEQILDDYDYQLYMMKEMGHMLPPLDYWNQKEKKFDEWQYNIIQSVHRNESIILKAPTSSGKTFIAMSAGIFHKKVLYVCPAKPVAYQVGAHFTHMGYKVHFLVDNQCNYSYDSKTNIFIGTPNEIEDMILSIGVDFDYAVFDEIHNLNKKDDGDTYENIIKLINCNFLALSATVKNIDFLRDKFQKINPDKEIKYVEYNERFINQQRWLWNGDDIIKIHPMCAFETIDEKFMENQLSFTPNDIALLWEKLEMVFEDIIDDIEDYSPDSYFPKRLITLNDCKGYELFLKNKLSKLNEDYPNEVQKVFNQFSHPSPKNKDIIKFIQKAKKKDMLPMLMFHTNENECRNVFNIIYQLLDNKEMEEYPFHYDILEKKQDLYKDYLQKREVYKSNIKITSSNPEYEIKNKMNIFDSKEKDTYISIMSDYYQTKINDIKNSSQTTEIRKKQTLNLNREMNGFLMNPDFCYQDVFQKHKDFIFTKSNRPMEAETIRNIRKEIKKTLGIKIPYESPLFQMLKRGIGLYIENMPDEYNWILQKLLSSKEIGVVISDRTLCLGIDLPVRTSCFLGINGGYFSKEDYLQMSGRAGRRGMDTRGNVIFYGDIDYLSLMKGELPEIQGNPNPIYNTYCVHPFSERVFQNMIHKERKLIPLPDLNISDKNKKIIWVLRNFKNVSIFLNEIDSIEKTLYNNHENDREIYLLEIFSKLINYDIIKAYKSNKITDSSEIIHFKTTMSIIISLYNNLNYQRYMITMDTMKKIFSLINRMIYNVIL